MASDRKMIGLRVVAGFTLNVILSKVGASFVDGLVTGVATAGRYQANVSEP